MPDAAWRFQVTPDELAALAMSVSRIRDELDGTAELVRDVAPALGSELVASALHHFVTGWRDGRKQISSEVSALSQMLTQAATTYAATDGELAAAVPSTS
jgi:hypothetical protein